MYNRMKMNLGIDIGSVSIKFAVFDKERLIRTEYLRHFGRPLEILIDFINNHSDIEYLAITGNGGRLLGELLGGVVVNEIIATVEGIKKIAPGLKTVIEIGGEDSKFFLIENNLKDFATNTICAAGTGIFLDQQAHRLNLSIDQFSSYALLSKRPSRIAGRCSVFAKSDMIHLQQIGTPMEDIIAGLCRSLARNFKSIIAQGKKFEPPIGFIGGVAANQGMVQSFESVLSLKPGELIVPKYFNCLGAIGSMYYCLETNNLGKYRGLKELHDYISKPKLTRRLPPLDGSERPAPRRSCLLPGSRIKGYLGIDVGSVSTNLVVIDSQNQVLSREYLWTQGDPIKAVQIGLDKIYKELGNLVEIVAVGTTGSGRYLIGDFVGADVIRNEITAQARAAISIDPQVDTIFEIGGQDSKFISLKDGVIVDFEMNKVCAAGTGSFLEEQSEILDTKIEDFGDTALRSKAPVFLGERCTVFMETEILHHQHQFIRKEDILAGLAYSIAGNYLNRVVQGKRIGNRIFFQGGVAANKAVVSAFEAILHKEIHVPDNFDVTGAIGVAMIARDENPNGWTRFKGFEIIQRKCRMETFECSGCSNLCDINIIELTQEEPIYYGGRCGKYEHREEKEGAKTDNYFDLRNEIFFKTENRTGETIGIPRTLIFYELFPFFNRLLTNLGFNVKLTDSTNKKIIHCGVEHSPAETCFPVKVANGHILHLIDQGIRRIFIPSVISVQKNRFFESSYVCPYVQTMPYTIRAGLSEKLGGTEIISPYLYFDRPRESIIKNLISAFNHFGIKLSEVKDAVDDAFDYNAKVNLKIKEIGEEAISKIDDIGFVIVSRPYNGYDAGINLDLARKIGEMGITAIPIDFLPLSFEDLYPEFSNMYWHYGQKLLAAASMIRHNPKLYAIYLSNFSCGPDSFLVKYFRELSGEKPFLLIELDEHSADAGLITRLEAFRDSIKGKTYITVPRPIKTDKRIKKGKKVYIPYMCDHAYILNAALRKAGINSEVMPPSDEETLILGRSFTTGRECLPAIITAGDMIKVTKKKDFDPDNSAFFMPQGSGPCRFGQYHRLHRLILDQLGFAQTPIFSPNQGMTLFEDLKPLGLKFIYNTWQGIVAVDGIDGLARKIRPYEANTGETQALYDKYLKLICDAVEKGESLYPLLTRARRDFRAILCEKKKIPKIGIVGEIFVRANPFSNNFLVKSLEDLGCEVLLPSIGEWFLYTNWTRIRRAGVRKEYKRYLKNKAISMIMKRVQSKIYNILGLYPETDEVKLQILAAPYIHSSFEGEAILSVGKTIDFIHEGANGVINVMPFTCMPGNIVSTIYKKLKEDFNDFPLLVFCYDGLEHPTDRLKLEAFVHQAKVLTDRHF